MQNESVKVFISSTSELQAERNNVMQQLKRMEMPFIAMEYFGSRDSTSIETCIEELRQCQVYIGIIGFRYGSLVQGSSKSFTESEYDYASERKLHRLIYLKKQPSSSDDSENDQEKHNKLDKFRNRLEKEHTVSYFKNASDLPGIIAGNLHRYITEKISEEISHKLIEKPELFQMPQVILKRAVKDLLHTVEFFDTLHTTNRNINKAQDKAWDFLRKHCFRFDGQFTVVNSNREVIFHDFMESTKDHISLIPEFDGILKNQVIGKNNGIIRLLDFLSSDYILIDEDTYFGSPSKKWLRFSVVPFSYFSPWDWYILVEAHNEIHGLEADEIQTLIDGFQKMGWAYIERKYTLSEKARRRLLES